VAISPLATSFREVYDGFARIRDLVATDKFREASTPAGCVT
jgi:hypothetical protein